MTEFEQYENFNWDLVSSIRASKRRTQVLEALAENPKMNGELADKLGVSTPWVRRQIKWLEERGLVKDLTESKPNYKLYGVTEDGKQILEVI
jgi:DNA-binding MarR family transcriptional regulator